MTVLMAPLDDACLQPGDVVAGRFRLVHQIRRESGWEVWRANDLTIGSPVALHLVAERAARPEQVREFVRLARELRHPAICPIFDVGVENGRYYCAMELIGGDSLRTVIRRVGRLPVERVVEIGRQLLGALAAVHAQGGVHGHLTAANVFLDRTGSVRLTGVGFVLPPDTSKSSGSDEASDYLAPEQRSPATSPTPQADLYAAGVLLYELLVGSRPAATSVGVRPRRPSSLVPGIDGRLDRILLQALQADPDARPASADAMAANLAMVSPGGKGPSVRAWISGAALAMIVAALAAVATWFLPAGPPALTEHDVIVLADFRNTTGDPVFDGTLKVALAVALEQSPFLRVYPDERARETLRLMQRAADEPVTPGIAREIAQREQLKAVVAGSIAPLGTQYVLVLEAIEAANGEIRARERVEVPAKEAVLTALGTAAARLRATLGESLASIQRFDAPLPQATTASLEALHAYALAHDQGRVVPRVDAIPHLKRAIELDPNFAMAYAALSGVYWNTGRSAEAPEFSRRAFALRERVGERERFVISWRYYVDAAQAWDKALEVAVSWTQTYPREAFAFNSLGLASAAFGDHEQAVRAFREAIRLDDRFVPPHGNLAGSLLALNRFDDARTRLSEASERGIAFFTVRRMRFLLALMNNDQEAMARELDQVRRSPEAAWADILAARASVFSGRVDAAHDLYQAGIDAARRDEARELSAQWTVEDAEAHAIAGRCDRAGPEIQAGLALSRDSFTLERAARALALCDDTVAVSRLTAELASRFPGATLTTRIHLPVIKAAAALGKGQAQQSIDLLESVAPYDHAPSAEFWPAYLRGQAYLRLGDVRGAEAQFLGILQRRGEGPTSPLYPLARLKLARAQALAGDIAAAQASYEAVFELWNRADRDLQPLQDARAEYGALR